MIGRTNAVIGKSGRWPSADEVQVTYTGTMADPREITDAAGNKYVLYELTSSGTLTVDKQVPVDICLVQGGQAGGSASNGDRNDGGVGGKMLNASIILLGSMQCTVGGGGGEGSSFPSFAAGGHSNIKTSSYTYSSSDFSNIDGYSGTGGGKSNGYGDGDWNHNLGDNKTKYVFGDESVYTYPICAGGAGGVAYYEFYEGGSSFGNRTYQSICRGGAGGTNGGDGNDHEAAMVNPETGDTTGWVALPQVAPALGGYNGGGNGAGLEEGGALIAPTNGTTYGSGGGGTYNEKDNISSSIGGGGRPGIGYQGVIFIRIAK